MLDKEYFTKCIKLLANAFDKPVTEEQMVAYYSILKDLNKEQMQFATKKIMEENKYFPRISDFHDKLKQIEQSTESKADEFVGHTMTLLGMYGADAVLNIFGEGTFPLKEPKRFIDPIAYEVVKRNLDRLRTHNSSDNMALHAQLKKQYISECNIQKSNIIKTNNPQLETMNEIKQLAETLRLK